jgi:hypothetical protein
VPLAIECKWTARDFDPANLVVFGRKYPKVARVVVTSDARPAFARDYDGARVDFLPLEALVARVTGDGN